MSIDKKINLCNENDHEIDRCYESSEGAGIERRSYNCSRTLCINCTEKIF